MKKILTLVCVVLLFVGCEEKKGVDTAQVQGERQEKERINITEEDNILPKENEEVVVEEVINTTKEGYIPPKGNEQVVVESEYEPRYIYAIEGDTKRLLATIPDYEYLYRHSPIRDRIFFWKYDYSLSPPYGNVFYFDIKTGEFIDTGLDSYVWYVNKTNRYLLVSNEFDAIPEDKKNYVREHFDLTSFPLVPKLYDTQTQTVIPLDFDFYDYVANHEEPAVLTLALDYNHEKDAFKVMYFYGSKGLILEGYIYLETMTFEITEQNYYYYP